MQARQHQVPGLGGGERQADGLRIAHLADEQDVRILAQRVAQPGGEVTHVTPHLPLAHQALHPARAERVLDGIFERDQHAGAALERVVGQRRQRGALARAGRAADDHQPVRQVDEIIERHRRAELPERGRRAAQDAQRRGEARRGLEDVEPEAAHALHADAEIGRGPGAERALDLGHDAGPEQPRERRRPLPHQRAEPAVDADHRRLAVDQVYVARPHRRRARQQRRELGRGRFAPRRCHRLRRRRRHQRDLLGARPRRRLDPRGRRRRRRRRRGRTPLAATAEEHHVDLERRARGPAAGDGHAKRPERERVVEDLHLPLRRDHLLALGREQLTEQLAQRLGRGPGHGQLLRRAVREHLRLAVAAQAELVGSLSVEEAQDAVDARHAGSRNP